MSKQRVMFSPVTRLSGLLSIEVVVEDGRIVEANASSTMFRAYEWIMRGHHITDGVYLTQRVCGICSLAHGAAASYLLDELYGNEVPENGQYLRNIMLASDFLQNHIRHFYLFSLPDFVVMPDTPPFHGQDLADMRLCPADNERLVCHSREGIIAAQEAHQLLALFGGKAPHQHSFVHGGVSVAPTADKIASALSLAQRILEFINTKLIPDTKLISRAYSDYFQIGKTAGRFMSFGVWRFGNRNERPLWPPGVFAGGMLTHPDVSLISEDVTSSWFAPNGGSREGSQEGSQEIPDPPVPEPNKPGAYTWVKSVQYAGQHYEGGPLARMLMLGKYRGGSSTMDRIAARSIEAQCIAELVVKWLRELTPGPPPINQKEKPIKDIVTATNEAMRGPLLHRAEISVEEKRVKRYDIITPTAWNFSPKDARGASGPAESALAGTSIPRSDMLFTVLGRIVRSFDPCMACATHVLNLDDNLQLERII